MNMRPKVYDETDTGGLKEQAWRDYVDLAESALRNTTLTNEMARSANRSAEAILDTVSTDDELRYQRGRKDAIAELHERLSKLRTLR